jgi:hypothetical protein
VPAGRFRSHSRKPNRGLTNQERQQEAFMATPDTENQESMTTTLVWTGAALIVVAIFAIFYIV